MRRAVLALIGLSSCALNAPEESIVGEGIALGDGARRLWTGQTDLVPDAILGEPGHFLHGDVTGDGVEDLVTVAYGGSVKVYGGGGFELELRSSFGTAVKRAVLVDQNGDGVKDLALIDSTKNPAGTAYLFNGPLSETRSLEDADAQIAGQSYQDSVQDMWTGDYDGDGRGDLVLALGDYNQNRSKPHRLYAGPFEGSYRSTEGVTVDSKYEDAVGDLNHDGRTDLAVFQIGESKVSSGGGFYYDYTCSFSMDVLGTPYVFRTLSAHVKYYTNYSCSQDAYAVGYWQAANQEAPNHIGIDTLAYRADNNVVRIGDGMVARTVQDQEYETFVTGDIDADGNIDLIQKSDAKIHLNYGPFNGLRSVPDVVLTLVSQEGKKLDSGTRLELADLSGDGVEDLVSSCSSGICIVDGRRAVPPPPEPEKPAPAVTISAGDLREGDLIVTEIMANPLECSDATGEWFEIYNASSSNVALDGLLVSNRLAVRFAVASDAVLAPGAYAVLGRGTADSFCGSFTPDGFYGGMTLSNTKDQVQIFASVSALVDATSLYDKHGAVSGKSLQLISAPDASANDAMGAWSTSSTKMPGSTESATPRAPN